MWIHKDTLVGGTATLQKNVFMLLRHSDGGQEQGLDIDMSHSISWFMSWNKS